MVDSHDTLEEFMRVNFLLMYHYKWSLTELENMMPFERDVYILMLIQQRKDEENRKKNLNG